MKRKLEDDCGGLKPIKVLSRKEVEKSTKKVVKKVKKSAKK